MILVWLGYLIIMGTTNAQCTWNVNRNWLFWPCDQLCFIRLCSNWKSSMNTALEVLYILWINEKGWHCWFRPAFPSSECSNPGFYSLDLSTLILNHRMDETVWLRFLFQTWRVFRISERAVMSFFWWDLDTNIWTLLHLILITFPSGWISLIPEARFCIR